MNTINGVKWRCIVPKKAEQTNDHLFRDTCKSNNIKIALHYARGITDLAIMSVPIARSDVRTW